ncbi:polysaccharide biosynthesis protein GumE, partial [Xanthomonas vasicola]
MLIRMSEETRVRWHNLLIELTLLVGVGYNLVLAFINANVFTVRPVITYAVEFMVYAACFLLGLGSMSRKRIALIVSGLGFIVALMFVRFLVNWQVDPKFFRDALVVFAFVVLGSAYAGSVPKLFIRMTIIVS